MLGYARVSLRQIQLLSARRALSQFQSLPQPVIGQLIDLGISTLLPSQFTVLCQSSLLRSSSNSLVCLPTSTRKTLIGELAIASTLSAKPGLAIYLAPYIAIGLQAARALKEHLPRPYRVHTLVGGSILICRLVASICRSGRQHPGTIRFERQDDLTLWRDLRIVVVDEAHVVSDGVRGVRLEALLSRLRLQQEGGRAFQILCLSAVMSESERFASLAGQMLAKIRIDILDGGEMAFATAASPLRLTPLGEAANWSLFSPESCRTIIAALDTLPVSNEFEAVAAYLLTI